MKIDHLILSELLKETPTSRAILPFLKNEYFQDLSLRKIYEIIDKHWSKYNTPPTRESIIVEMEESTSINETLFSSMAEAIDLLDGTEADSEWLLEQTETFCKRQAVYNALTKGIQIYEEDLSSWGQIPELFVDALSVSFDPEIGHDYVDNGDDRYDYMTQEHHRLSFGLDMMNKITGGGLPEGTLSCLLAGTNVGKTLALCSFAADNLIDHKNVLYLTMEMAEEEIAKRIDANLLNTPLSDLQELPKATFLKRINKLKALTKGRLIIKQYPTSVPHVGNFRHLLNELKLKRSFVPDVVYIDYINICSSQRFKVGGNAGMYQYVKAIAEELRGLAVEKKLRIITATQTNRTGFGSSDVTLEDTAESFGLPQTADFMIAMMRTEELDQLNQVMIKQLKNRFGDKSRHSRFVVGFDTDKQRLYNVDSNAQEDLYYDVGNSTPVFDTTEMGNPNHRSGVSQFTTGTFKDFRS